MPEGIVEFFVSVVGNFEEAVFNAKGVCEVVSELMISNLDEPVVEVFAVE